MIIESLRSTQSSLEMGDEIAGNMLSGQEGHPQVCKVAVGSFVGAKSKTKSLSGNQQTNVSSLIKHDSSDSDSDDSVDRGIEEAILEYLKEKDDHKRKAEPCTPFLQSSKIPRKDSPLPDVPKLKSESNAFSIASSQFAKSVPAEPSPAPALPPLKKYIKNKASLLGSTVGNLEVNKAATSFLRPKEQTKVPYKTNSLFNKVKCPVPIKMEEDSNDSSSDDGIEEAIQRYQLEKKEQQNRGDAFKPHTLSEESDSTSDDGIEEAIRSYQLAQLQEKSVLKPFFHKKKTSLLPAVGSTSTGSPKKHKLGKKRNTTERESFLPPPASLFTPKNTFADGQRSKGNGLFSFKEQPTHASPKVNTTAELMCAEAILDISKTVMPGAFHQSINLNTRAPSESTPQSSLPDDDSDESSVDSEDGIEQEIMKFLEQKAQMHKQPPGSSGTREPRRVNEPGKTKDATQRKPQRSSLTQRRKHKEENSSTSSSSGIDSNTRDTFLKPSHEHRGELSPLVISTRSQSQPVVGSRKAEQSGDKSSSLDSDEDLDTAIKDLLKTKKKSKRKIRDLKQKSRKCLKEEEPLPANALQTKKIKSDLQSKSSALKKVHKSKNDIRDKPRLIRKIISPNRPDKKRTEQEGVTEKSKGTEGKDTLSLQIKEDSSSVDSDDSIEQEIRKFLAEKAEKVSTAERSKDEGVTRNGTTVVCTPLQEKDIKQENQLAEIPRKGINPPLSGPVRNPPQDRPLPPTPQGWLPDKCISTASAHLSRLSSVQSCSPSLLEPADGAGPARSVQWRPSAGRGDIQDVAAQAQRVRSVFSPNTDHSRSESIKWRQSFGLPTSSDTRNLSRTQFHITSSKIRETASAAPPHQGRGINLKSPLTLWSARTSRAPFPCPTDTTLHTPVPPPLLNLVSAARLHQGMSVTQSLAAARGSQCSRGETESMVHMPKDKSVFVELESDRTNHVQVRSRERSEGQKRADVQSEIRNEVESMKTDDRDLEGAEDEFIDEADCERGSREIPEKKQGFSTL